MKRLAPPPPPPPPAPSNGAPEAGPRETEGQTLGSTDATLNTPAHRLAEAKRRLEEAAISLEDAARLRASAAITFETAAQSFERSSHAEPPAPAPASAPPQAEQAPSHQSPGSSPSPSVPTTIPPAGLELEVPKEAAPRPATRKSRSARSDKKRAAQREKVRRAAGRKATKPKRASATTSTPGRARPKRAPKPARPKETGRRTAVEPTPRSKRRGERESSRRKLWKRIIVATAILQGAIVLAVVTLPNPPVTSVPRTELSSATNSRGNYYFSYPKTWNVRHDGTVSKVISPAQDVVVAIGTAPDGGVAPLSEKLVGGLGQMYKDVRVISEEMKAVGPHVGMQVEGRAVNEAGSRLRFVALTVAGGKQNYALTAFISSDVDRSFGEEPVQEVLSSFRATSKND